MPKETINVILQICIQIYGAPEKFLTGNGEKFTDNGFLEMCQAMNKTGKVTVP